MTDELGPDWPAVWPGDPNPDPAPVIHLHDVDTHDTLCDTEQDTPIIATTDAESVTCPDCLGTWYGIRRGEDT